MLSGNGLLLTWMEYTWFEYTVMWPVQVYRDIY